MECIILAAGLSTRMGVNKMLLPFSGKTILEKTIEPFLETCIRIFVVTGPGHEQLQKLLFGQAKVRLVNNSDYKSGMFGSVKTGIGQTSESFFVMPGDMPLLKQETVRLLCESSAPVTLPSYRGVPGHPVLIQQALVPAIMASSARSLRECLSTYPARVVEVEDRGTVTDIDTIDDYLNEKEPVNQW